MQSCARVSAVGMLRLCAKVDERREPASDGGRDWVGAGGWAGGGDGGEKRKSRQGSSARACVYVCTCMCAHVSARVHTYLRVCMSAVARACNSVACLSLCACDSVPRAHGRSR